MHYQCLILFQQFFDYTEMFLKPMKTGNEVNILFQFLI